MLHKRLRFPNVESCFYSTPSLAVEPSLCVCPMKQKRRSDVPNEIKDPCFKEWEWDSHELEEAANNFVGRMTEELQKAKDIIDKAVEVEVRKALVYAFTEYFGNLLLRFKPVDGDIIIEIDSWAEDFDYLEIPRSTSVLKQLWDTPDPADEYLIEVVKQLRQMADKIELDGELRKDEANAN